MMRLLFVAFFFCSFFMKAQNTDENVEATVFDKVTQRSFGEGQIVLHQPESLQHLMQGYVANNAATSKIEGFRIQLYSGTGAKARQEAQEVKTKMLSTFPDVTVSVEYNAPFWRVRTGSFRHKHEALPLLKRIKHDFPNSYIVRDAAINLSELQ
jgi:hypothetical protein